MTSLHRQLAAADGGVHLLDRFLRQARQALLELVVGIVLADALRKAETSRRRPSSEYCLRSASRAARRMAERALPVTAMRSQAAGGVCPLAASTSTSSPFLSCVVSGSCRPLITAPTQELPMSVCTA